ncbi:protein of unknown function [Rhodovastum atsumiense]|nr:protein of unknown function [Rhodovastum atsumiense]
MFEDRPALSGRWDHGWQRGNTPATAIPFAGKPNRPHPRL